MFIKLSISKTRQTFSQHLMKFLFGLCCWSVLGSPMQCITSLLVLFNFIYSLQKSGNYSKQGEGSFKFLCYLTKLFYLSPLANLIFLRTLETKVKVIFVLQQEFEVRRSLRHEGILFQDKISICMSAVQYVFLVDSLILVKENVSNYELLMLTISRDEWMKLWGRKGG